MGKQIHNILSFEGGLNTNHDPRDLADSNCQKADNIFFSNLGRLSLAHTEQALSEPDVISSGAQGFFPGFGLFKFLSDYDTSNGAEVEDGKEYVIRNHNQNFYTHDLTNAWSSAIGNVGSQPNVKPVYYNVDSILRIGDAAFANTLNTRKWYGRVSRSYFNAESATTSFEWMDANPELPIESSDAVSSRIKNSQEYSETQPGIYAGYISMIASAVNPSYTPWIGTDTWNDGDYDGYWYIKYASEAAGGDGNYSELINSSSDGAFFMQDGTWTDDNHGGSGSSTVTLSDAPSYDSSVNNKAIRMQKKYTASDATFTRMAIAMDNAVDLTDKSIYFDVYMSPHMQAFHTAVHVKWGTSIGDWNSSGNWWEQVMSMGDFPSGAWKTVEVDTSVFDNTDGTPTLSAITDFSMSFACSDDDVTFGYNDSSPTYGNPNTGDCLIYNIRYGEPSSGAWEGKYKFYHTWIYDENQESMYRYFGDNTNGKDESNTITLGRQPLSCRIHARESGSGGFAGGNKRITGANIYYHTLDADDAPIEDEPVAMLHVDLERGVKKFGTDDVNFYPWLNDESGDSSRYEAPSNGNHDAVLTFASPPTIHTFSLNAGYKPKDFIKDIKWKCATVMNRRAYVGNVQIKDERIGGITTVRKYSDRVYKSIVNKPDIFTHGQWIDVAVNDGESVTALSSYADRLLEFKEETMYIINATRSIEYLEDTYKFKGVWGQAAVCQIGKGVAWVNKNGLYIYDGQNVIDVQEGVIDDTEWETLIGEKPMISYNQRHKYLFIMTESDYTGWGNNASNKCVFYNLPTKSFSLMPSKGTATDAIDEGYLSKGDKSNIIILKDGSLLYAQKSGSAVSYNTVKPASNSEDGIEGVNWRSKDIFFSTPHNKTTVSRVHITYKGNTVSTGSGNTDTNVELKYATNGSSSYSGTFKDVTGVYDNTGNGGLQSGDDSEWKRAELVPTSAIKDIYSISLALESSGKVPKDFEVNDLALTYREKSAK